MTIDKRIESFAHLGELLRRYHEDSCEPDLAPVVLSARKANEENKWFTPENIRLALNSIGEELQYEQLAKWTSRYGHHFSQQMIPKTIGVVMAGNIPAIGFHDFLCVLISGHKLVARLSSSDLRLIPAMAEILTRYLPEWRQMITFTSGRLDHFDSIIATGSDNSSRYFEYYFGKYPHIIRKNRNSVAIIKGDESNEVLMKLADDIMLYFGMGCRSVSKIWIPEGYDFTALVKSFGKYAYYADHNKYRNNYDYSSSIFMVNRERVIDTGFLLLKEDPALNSRISVLNYEYYSNVEKVIKVLKTRKNLIQCIVCNSELNIPVVVPGMAQHPALWDYADEVDTLDFLLSRK